MSTEDKGARWIHFWYAHEIGQAGRFEARCEDCDWSTEGELEAIRTLAMAHTERSREVPPPEEA